MTLKMKCSNCRGPAQPVKEFRERSVGRRSVLVENEFFRCKDCGTEFVTPTQMDANQRRAAEALRAKHDLLSPEEIRAIRESLGLTQSDLELLLGVGSKTVVRWERGTVVPSGASNTLLRLLQSSPSVLECLRKLADSDDPGELMSSISWWAREDATFYWRVFLRGLAVAEESLLGDPLPAPRQRATMEVRNAGRFVTVEVLTKEAA